MSLVRAYECEIALKIYSSITKSMENKAVEALDEIEL